MTFPRLTVHRAIFWLHLLTGTVAGLVILVMSVTGVLLAFEPQIVDYAERSFRRVTPPSPDAQKLSMDVILAKVKAARPDARPTAVVSWSERGGTVRVAFGRDDGVFVNPYTGELLGPGSRTHDAMHVIEDWHRWLGSRDVGRPYTGAYNLAFLGLAISGLYLSWPRRWTRHVLRGSVLFDGGLRGRARDWNWHNVIGFWCAPVLIVLTVTGAVMSYQWANDLLYRLTGNEPPPAPGAGPGGGQAPAGARPAGQRDGQRAPEGRLREGEPGRRDGERPRSAPRREPASVAAFWARAEQQVPGWTSIFLRLPPRPGGPVTAFIQEPAPPGPGPMPVPSSPSTPSPPRSSSGSPTPAPTLAGNSARGFAISTRAKSSGSGDRSSPPWRRREAHCSSGLVCRWPGAASSAGTRAGQPCDGPAGARVLFPSRAWKRRSTDSRQFCPRGLAK